MSNDSRNQLIVDIKSLLSEKSLTDLTIICGAKRYQVHKLVLCARSPFFANMFKFNGKEAATGEVDLSGDDQLAIDLLIDYLYQGDYKPYFALKGKGKGKGKDSESVQVLPHTCKDQKGYYRDSCGEVCKHHVCGDQCVHDCVDFLCGECMTIGGDAGQLLTHAKMYELGDKYQVSGLKGLCVEQFKWACVKFWKSPEFAMAAAYALQTTPENDKGLRAVIFKTIAYKWASMDESEVRKLTREFGDIAYDILQETEQNRYDDSFYRLWADLERPSM